MSCPDDSVGVVGRAFSMVYLTPDRLPPVGERNAFIETDKPAMPAGGPTGGVWTVYIMNPTSVQVWATGAAICLRRT